MYNHKVVSAMVVITTNVTQQKGQPIHIIFSLFALSLNNLLKTSIFYI